MGFRRFPSITACTGVYMSEILLSTGEDAIPTVVPDTPELKAKQLPEPKTYNMLCAIPEAEEEYESGFIKAAQTMHYEEVLTPVLFVMKMGPDCYKDEKRFPSGPSCKEGDFVICKPNSGTRIKIHGREFRIINDDSVMAVVEDPRGITRN